VTELAELDPLRDEGYHEPAISLHKATWRLSRPWSNLVDCFDAVCLDRQSFDLVLECRLSMVGGRAVDRRAKKANAMRQNCLGYANSDVRKPQLKKAPPW
jgi:hypothetical protein